MLQFRFQMHVATKQRQFAPTTTSPVSLIILQPGQTKQIIFGGYRMQTKKISKKNGKKQQSQKTRIPRHSKNKHSAAAAHNKKMFKNVEPKNLVKLNLT